MLKGKIAVITGGNGVLGTAFARILNKEGVDIAIWDKEISKDNDKNFYHIRGDVSDENQVEAMLQKTIEFFGDQIDILINCAGGNKGKCNFVDVDIDDFRKIFNTNVCGGLMIPTKVFAKYWIKEKLSGTIINMASMASYKPLSGIWAYDASKSAVKNLTEGIAKELAKYEIRINAIAPGFIVTHQNKDLLMNGNDLTERGKQIINNTPMGRFGKSEDLTGVLLLLADDDLSGFITGVTIPVDGGFLVNNV
jgi:NAD(P)-dependent dehydrogenase (short-subunit alcohol dehydrogenase family)